MSPVAFVNYTVQVAEALSVMVQKKKKKELNAPPHYPKLNKKGLFEF